MEKVLNKIGKFFKSVWSWIKNTAWVQPCIIVIVIFGIIFSINPIIKGIQSAINSNDKVGAFYKDHKINYSSVQKTIAKNQKSLVVYVDITDDTNKKAAYDLEIYLKNFYKDTEGAKVYVVDIGSKNFLETNDDKGKKYINEVTDELSELYNRNLPADKFTYEIYNSSWGTAEDSEYLDGTTSSLYINSPTYVLYEKNAEGNAKAIDVRFDITKYKDTNGNEIKPLTILKDFWNKTNKATDK